MATGDAERGAMTRRGLLGAGAALGAGLCLPRWSWAQSQSMAGLGGEIAPWLVWDDEADPIVAAVIDRGEVPAVNALLRGWTKNSDALPDGLPAGPARLHRARPAAPVVGRRRPAQGRGRVQQEARHLPGRRLRLRQRHDEHGHPARGPRGLLLQGRRRHEAPHLAHREVRLRHRLARRLPRSRRGDDRHRREDAPGARRRPPSPAAVAALDGRGRRGHPDQPARHPRHLAQPAHLGDAVDEAVGRRRSPPPRPTPSCTRGRSPPTCSASRTSTSPPRGRTRTPRRRRSSTRCSPRHPRASSWPTSCSTSAPRPTAASSPARSSSR